MLLIAGNTADMVLLVHKYNLRFVILRLLRRHLTIAHDDHMIAHLRLSCRRTIEADHAASRLSGDGVCLKAVAVLNIDDLNQLIF